MKTSEMEKSDSRLSASMIFINVASKTGTPSKIKKRALNADRILEMIFNSEKLYIPTLFWNDITLIHESNIMSYYNTH